MKKRVLFLCTSNRCRSQMAEALVNHDLGDRFQAFSAGTKPTTPHPMAIEVLAEIGVAHPNARSKHMDEFKGVHFDHVITLCDNADQVCPVFIGGVKRVHMGFDDPDKSTGNPEQVVATFRRIRDEIREKVERYLTSDEAEEKISIKLELPE